VATREAAASAGSAVADLERDRALLSRSSTAERVASILRDRITDGSFAPGTRLSEEAIGNALGVSRNTLREAFRLLSHERLLIHELNRGVFVRELAVDDVVDLYRVRRYLECAAVRQMTSPPGMALGHLRDAIASAEAAVEEQRWLDVGTANMRFHGAIVELGGSPRLDEMMRQVLAELRLVFHVMKSPRAFHEPYLPRNRDILKLIEAGDAEGAAGLLDNYLHDAEQQLVRAYSRMARTQA
jgi:DNA-binding GntR family transcriptional regulator